MQRRDCRDTSGETSIEYCNAEDVIEMIVDSFPCARKHKRGFDRIPHVSEADDVGRHDVYRRYL